MRAALQVTTVAVAALSLSCGGWSADLPPSPTQLPLPGDKVVELPPDFRPTGFFGDHAAGIGQDGEVYLLNVINGERLQVTDDGHPKYEAVISADHVAWADQRRKIELPGGDRANPGYGIDRFLRDLDTGEARGVTDVPAERWGLRVSGSRLVWQDNRN